MKLLFTILISILAITLCAGTDFHWGVKAGMNMAQHYGTKDQIEGYIVKAYMVPGFCTGAYINFPITERFSLQQEAFFSQKGSKEKIKVKNQPISVTVDYRMDYIELPVILNMIVIQKDKWNLSSMAGSTLSIKTYSDYHLNGTVTFNAGDTLEVIPITAHSKLSEMDLFDYSFLFGGKLAYERERSEWYVEYRFTAGWNSLKLPTYMNNGNVILRNMTYSILLGIEY